MEVCYTLITLAPIVTVNSGNGTRSCFKVTTKARSYYRLDDLFEAFHQGNLYLNPTSLARFAPRIHQMTVHLSFDRYTHSKTEDILYRCTIRPYSTIGGGRLQVRPCFYRPSWLTGVVYVGDSYRDRHTCYVHRF